MPEVPQSRPDRGAGWIQGARRRPALRRHLYIPRRWQVCAGRFLDPRSPELRFWTVCAALITLAITPANPAPIHVRAVGIPERLYYEMDADMPHGRALDWPIKEVVIPERIAPTDIGVYAFHAGVGGDPVLLPVTIATGAAYGEPGTLDRHSSGWCGSQPEMAFRLDRRRRGPIRPHQHRRQPDYTRLTSDGPFAGAFGARMGRGKQRQEPHHCRRDRGLICQSPRNNRPRRAVPSACAFCGDGTAISF